MFALIELPIFQLKEIDKQSYRENEAGEEIGSW